MSRHIVVIAGVAGVAGFAAAFGYYMLLAQRLRELGSNAATAGRQPGWVPVVELAKHLLVAAVVVGLAARAGVTSAVDGALLGTALWLGFPVVLLLGSVVHEKVAWRLAALHAGDWLAKLLIIGAIAGAWL
jgi:nitrate reductase gamma subunit